MSTSGIVVLMAFQGMLELSSVVYFIHFGLLDYHSYSDFIRRQDQWNRRTLGIKDNVENYQWLVSSIS